MPRPRTALHPTGQYQTDSTQGLGAVSARQGSERRSPTCNLTLGSGKAMALHVQVTVQTEMSGLGGPSGQGQGAELGSRLGWHLPGKAFRGQEEVWSQCEEGAAGMCPCPPAPCNAPPSLSLEQPSVRNLEQAAGSRGVWGGVEG